MDPRVDSPSLDNVILSQRDVLDCCCSKEGSRTRNANKKNKGESAAESAPHSLLLGSLPACSAFDARNEEKSRVCLSHFFLCSQRVVLEEEGGLVGTFFCPCCVYLSILSPASPLFLLFFFYSPHFFTLLGPASLTSSLSPPLIPQFCPFPHLQHTNTNSYTPVHFFIMLTFTFDIELNTDQPFIVDLDMRPNHTETLSGVIALKLDRPEVFKVATIAIHGHRK